MLRAFLLKHYWHSVSGIPNLKLINLIAFSTNPLMQNMCTSFYNCPTENAGLLSKGLGEKVHTTCVTGTLWSLIFPFEAGPVSHVLHHKVLFCYECMHGPYPSKYKLGGGDECKNLL